MTAARLLCGAVACLGLAAPAAAQPNLLTVNPSFESGHVAVNPGSVNSPDLSGWAVTLPAGGAAGTANDQPWSHGRDGSYFAYLGTVTAAPAVMSTAAAARPEVQPGWEYRLSFVILRDYGAGSSPAGVSLQFFDNATQPVGQTTVLAEVSRTDLAPTTQSGERVFEAYELAAFAPAGAGPLFAGVTVSSPSAHIVDSFVLTPVPEPAAVGLVAAAGLAGAAGLRRRRG